MEGGQMKLRLAIAAIVYTAGLQACSSGPVQTSSAAYRAEARAGEPSLEQIRAASERFKDVNVALAEGYVRDPMDHCATAEDMGRDPALGGMGIHYSKRELLGISGPPNPKVSGTGTHTDFLRPAILIYEPQQDGSLQLIAVENLVFEEAWKAAGNAVRPSFHGVPYDRMEDDPSTPLDEAHMFVAHYDRHIWVHRPNKNGVFAPFNPAVSCKHHRVKTGG
jgi:hypothetical protein